jgi:hypothetical protein
MVSSPWYRRCGLVIVAIVTVISVAVSVAYVVAVVIDRCHRCRLLCPSWRRSNGGAGWAEKVVAQRWRWRRSNGDG